MADADRHANPTDRQTNRWGEGTDHDGHQGANNREGGGLAQDDLGQDHTEDRLQRLHSVRQADSHCCEGQVGSHMTNGMHGGWPRNGLELSLGDGLHVRCMQVSDRLGGQVYDLRQ